MWWLKVVGAGCLLVALVSARYCLGLVKAAWPPPPATALPPNFPAPVYAPAQQVPDRQAFALGRQLFYDIRLSHDNKVSCASCHQQALAFASAERLSPGVGGRLGRRNAPALQNLRWKRTFFADGGPKNLETLPLAPLTNPLEMGTTLPAVLAKLNADPAYKRRFAAVYGRRPIDSYQLLRALAQFTAALTSANSRYDKYVRHEAGGTLTTQELRGRALFAAKCSSCHATDLFTDESFRNNGLNARFPQDSGRVAITFLPADRGRFKVPSLRNVALTAPYMHDGRFRTLGQVLAHYDHGMVNSPTLDPIFRRADGQLGVPLTAAEQRALVAFLHTLTDESFCQAPELAAR
ncbi:MAG: cytochrome-c peroxidase [Janthinobacterium lividum]